MSKGTRIRNLEMFTLCPLKGMMGDDAKKEGRNLTVEGLFCQACRAWTEHFKQGSNVFNVVTLQ